MTSKEAKSILNEFRNRNYNNSNDTEFREVANALDVILPKYVKLEEQIRNLFKTHSLRLDKMREWENISALESRVLNDLEDILIEMELLQND